LGILQSDALIVKRRLEEEHLQREHWEGEYQRYSLEVHRLNKEGDKNHDTIKELRELVQHLKETATGTTDGESTQTLVILQRELESRRAEVVALKLTLDSVDADLESEQINHRGTRDALFATKNTLTTTKNNFTTALLNTAVVNTQLVTVRQELEFEETGDTSEMTTPFCGRLLDDVVFHVLNFDLWLCTKKLPARAAALHSKHIDEEWIRAEISYFQSTLRDAATLWFDNLIINVDPACPAGNIGTLAELVAAFQVHFLFDPAQKWRHLSDLFKTRQTVGERSEEYIRRVQEEGRKARATEEQILNTIMGGFLPHIQASVFNHDIDVGAAGLASIKKWSAVAETFGLSGYASADTARLQRQIEDLTAKLESTQMRWVDTNTPGTADLSDDNEEAERPASSRNVTPERNRGRAQGGGNRSRSPAPANTKGGEVQRSRSSGQPTQQPMEQQRDDSRPRYDNQGASAGRQYGQEEREPYDGQQRSYNRGGPPRKGMQPSFYWGNRGAFRGGSNRFDGQTANNGQNFRQNSGQNMGQSRGCNNCNSPYRCVSGTCPATAVQCFNCSKIEHFSNKCWRKQNQ